MFHPVNNLDKLLLYLLRVLPKSLISRITGMVSRIPLPVPFNILLIRLYAAIFHVDLSESEKPLSRYHTLNEFFVRKLKSSARPIDPDPHTLLSPVDGRVMACGKITGGSLLQAKEWRYTLRDLLQDPGRATNFLEGSFCTLYLSPSDCHRIHIPLDGAVDSLKYIPGHLFPVNQYSVSRIRNLFVLNERLILYLNTGRGTVAMVMVGATNVGKIRVFFDEIRSRVFRKGPFQRQYRPVIGLQRGAEIGCFEMGSTVILLFEKEQVDLTVHQAEAVRIGKAIGMIRENS